MTTQNMLDAIKDIRNINGWVESRGVILAVLEKLVRDQERSENKHGNAQDQINLLGKRLDNPGEYT